MLKTVANPAEIDRVLHGRAPADRAAVDRLMIDAGGTETKSRLGPNAIGGTWMAVTPPPRPRMMELLGAAGACGTVRT